MDKIEDDYWVPIKRLELKEVIGSLLGYGLKQYPMCFQLFQGRILILQLQLSTE